MFTLTTFDVSLTTTAPARKKNGRGQARHLDEDELVTFFNHLVSEKWQAVFAIAYFTGSRISEVLKLKVEDVEDDRITFRRENAKTKIRREIALQPQLRAFIEAYESPTTGYLFPAYQNSKRKTHVTRQAAHKVLKEVVAAAAPELDGVSTHSFRRSFATNLAKAGKPEAEIGRLLGHKQGSGMTPRYIG
ncbi:MAG: site-specific integrase [Cyanobacteria bacterium J06621_3]